MVFFLLSIGLASWMVWEHSRIGARPAMWRGWLVALTVLPAWLVGRFGGVQCDFRTIAALTGLLLLAGSPGGLNFGRLLWTDVCVIAVTLAQVAAEYQCGQMGPATIPERVRLWLLPYLVGRVFFANMGELPAFLEFVTRLLTVICAVALLEAVLQINGINLLFRRSFGILEQGEGYRWGMKRAQGNIEHPIFFGMILVMLLPWALEAWHRARHGKGPRWWRLTPWAIAIGLFATVSRGPQLSAVATLAAFAFFRNPRLRLPLVAMAAVAAVALYVARDSLVDALSNFAGEKGEEASIVMIDGEEYEYTGTNHRVLLFKVYREAFERIGTFGYGFELRRMPLDEDLALRFGSIDNHYILFFLRNGYPGLITFAALTITTILSLARLAWNVEDGRSVLAAGLCGALVGIGVTLFSVWMAPSFGQAWLFCAGLAGNLRMLKGDVREPAVHRPSHPAIAGRRKPWPGLAPQHTL